MLSIPGWGRQWLICKGNHPDTSESLLTFSLLADTEAGLLPQEDAALFYESFM